MGKKRDTIDIAVTERRKRVLELRRMGFSFRAIAEELGVSHVTISKDFAVVMDEIKKQNLEHAQTNLDLELERLEHLRLTLMADLKRPNATSQSRLNYSAVNALIKVSERRSKLLGLDIQHTDITSAGESIKGYIGISPDMWDGD